MIVLDSQHKDLAPWLTAFRQELGTDVVLFSECDDLTKITTAVVWNHRPDLFNQLPNLKLVCSMGAGVDHILKDPFLPVDVPVTRIVSAALSDPMSNFCIGAVIYFQRQFDKYARDKVGKIWDQEFDPERSMTVGIMGMGELGTDLARKLTYLGFEVSGWSRSRKHVEGVKSYVTDELNQFLKSVTTIVVMLPATPDNRQIINKKLLCNMNKGSFLINVARGHHQVDEDILWALDTGILDGAFLDVFPVEPLPTTSPLWEHPKVFITPHLAVVTKVQAAVPLIVENYRRLANNLPLLGLVDKQKGY